VSFLREFENVAVIGIF